MSSEDAALATYATMRAISRACAEVSGAYMRTFEGRVSRAYIFCTLLSARSLLRDDLDEGQDYAAYSIRSLSASLKMPFETARVATNDLIARGLCRKDRSLVRAASGSAFRAETQAAGATVLRQTANILATMAELRQGRIPVLPLDAALPEIEGRAGGAREEMWAASFLRFMIRIMEMYLASVDDPLDGLVLGTIQALNIADYPLERGRLLSFSDADRRPVSVRTIASKLSCPRETVRRRCNKLAAEGLIHYVGRRGWIVPRFQIERLSLGPTGYPQIMTSLGRMLEELRRAQFPVQP